MYTFLRRHVITGFLLCVLVVALAGGLRWCFAQPSIEPLAKRGAVKFPDQPTVILNVTGLTEAYGTLSQPTTFANPVGNAVDRQQILLEVCSAASQTVTWGDKFQTKYRIPLPRKTGGNNTCELWRWRFHQDVGLWFIMAMNPPPEEEPLMRETPVPTPRTR